MGLGAEGQDGKCWRDIKIYFFVLPYPYFQHNSKLAPAPASLQAYCGSKAKGISPSSDGLTLYPSLPEGIQEAQCEQGGWHDVWASLSDKLLSSASAG